MDWETRSEGNLEIVIDPHTITNIDEGFKNKIKIVVEFELEEKYIGVVFQTFYDEKIDSEYDICYTPNFYFNTANWVPCIYDLKSQILWRAYIITNKDYCAYFS